MYGNGQQATGNGDARQKAEVAKMANDTNGLIDRSALATDQFDWGLIKWLVTPGQPDAAKLTLGEVVLLPGEGHDRHNHPDAEEVLYVLSGSGEQMVDDGEPYAVRAGDAIYVPQGIFHSTRNTGWETMRLLAIYNPGGSETGLRELPDYREVPAGEAPKLG
jgi:oxalate decarboxylase/phosphoglucose isomerase-like protein (cupin superfamily)